VETEAIIKLVFYLFIAPFWLAWKVLVLLWQFVIKPANQALADRSAAKHQQSKTAQLEDKQKAREAARAEQFAALRAAAPQAPPQRMRATIHINEIKEPITLQQRVTRLLAEDSWITVEIGEQTRHAVDMLLEMSETERGIIQQHQLENIIIEDTPAFTQRQIIQAEIQQDDDTAATKDLLLKEVKKVVNKDAVEKMKATRIQTRVGDYLVSPFTRVFDTPHEAKQYADQLKTKLLPSIKDLIESYREHMAQQTVEF
jgi:hypothetical protein